MPHPAGTFTARNNFSAALSCAILTVLSSGLQVLNRELEQANNVLRTKRSEVQRIEEEVALLMQVPCCHG